MASPSRDLSVNLVGNSDKLAKSFSGVGGTMRKVGKAAGLALAGAVTAAVAVGAKGVGAAIKFDEQMKEVFTLLPGISGKEMKKMEGQVKDFATKFGVLPEEVVPALYQSLSAGVPKKNVFGFLETAQKAAKGGVTDLSTAVDGISSVVNAYGTDVISATEASDLMFTAVKLGKTDFESLSKSLFNVIPSASALGVEFGDVTAGLASLTAQGTPTSVATTQMRQMFVELSKATGKTSEVFQEVSGKTFKEFIASGGNTQEALQLLEQHAKESGVGINDLFGSVEAGNAALGLTGKGTESFSKNLKEMQNASGATDKAFNTMQKGLGPVIDRLKAFGQVVLINIGQFLIPKLEAVVDFVEKHWPTISKVIGVVRDAIGRALSWVVDHALTPLVDAAKNAVGWIVDNWDQIRAEIAKVGEKVGKVLQVMADGIRAAFQWLMSNQPALIGVIAALTVGMAAYAVQAALAAAATLAAAAPFILVGAAIAALVAGVIWAYQNWDVFRNAVDAVVQFFRQDFIPIAKRVGEAIKSGFQDALAVARRAIEITQGVIRGFVNVISKVWDRFGGSITGIAKAAWEAITGTVKGAIRSVRGIIKTFTSLIKGDWSGVWEGIRDFFGGIWDQIKARLKGAGTILLTVGKEVIRGLWDGMRAVWKNVREWVKGIPGALKTLAKNAPKWLVAAGKQILRGLWAGAQFVWKNVREWVKGIPDVLKKLMAKAATWLVERGKQTLRGMWDGVRAVWKNVKKWFVDLPGNLRDILKNAVKALVERGKQFLRGLWDGVKNVAQNVWSWFRDLPGRFRDILSNAASALYWRGRQFLGGLWDGLVDTARNVWEWTRGIPGRFRDILSNAASALYWRGRQFLSGLWSGLIDTAGNIWEWLRGVPQRFRDILSNAASALYWRGRQFLGGLLDGLKDFFFDNVVTWLKDLPTRIKNILGGAASWLYNVGKDVVTGLKDGIVDTAKAVIKGALQLLISPINTFTSGLETVIDLIPGINVDFKPIKLAAGGVGPFVDPNQTGPFATAMPRAIVGEGSRTHPEFVIPTDPKFRDRARALTADLLGQLGGMGVPGMFLGGILDPAGDALNWGKERVEDGLGWVRKNVIAAAYKPVDALFRAGLGALPNNNFWVRDIGHGLRELVADWVKGVGRVEGAVAPGAFGRFAGSPGGGVEQWRGVALAALDIANQSSLWVNDLLTQMQHESGGNPSAVNRWDINWIAGHPSAGLMQVIGPTYAAYKHPSYDRGPYMYGTSIDPLSNILASIRYTLARYGSLGAWSQRGFAGYASGGVLPSFHNGGIVPGHRGQDVLARLEAGELVVPADSAAAGRGGGDVIYNVRIDARNMTPEELLAALQKLQRRRGPLPIRVQ